MFKKILNKKVNKTNYTVKEYYFSKIKSKELATRSIKDISILFIGFGLFGLLMQYFSSYEDYETYIIKLIISVIFIILAGILFKWRSRLAAILILLMVFDVLITTRFHVINLIFFLAAIRSVQATFKFHNKEET